MKKWIAVLLMTGLLLFVATACGDSGSDDETAVVKTTATEIEEASEEVTETEEPEETEEEPEETGEPEETEQPEEAEEAEENENAEESQEEQPVEEVVEEAEIVVEEPVQEQQQEVVQYEDNNNYNNNYYNNNNEQAAAAAESVQSSAPAASSSAPAASQATKASTSNGFSFVTNGVTLTPGASFNSGALPAASSFYSAASCAVNGVDNTYTYSNFELTAFDEGYGEVIYSIYLFDGAATAEGLKIGDSASKVTQLYGTGQQTGAALIYTKGQTQLQIIIQGDTVASITYYYII